MLIFFCKNTKKIFDQNLQITKIVVSLHHLKQETNLKLSNNIETHGVTVAQVILVHLVGVRIPVSLLF